MRARLFGPKVIVTVRPAILATVDSDVFGDTSILTKDTRAEAITGVPMQLTYTSGSRYSVGSPGRQVDVRAFALVLKRDADRLGWTPQQGDIVEIAGYDKLFISEIQPAFPIRPSVRNPNGGFDGWRIPLTSSAPTMAAATSYS